ncbi:hypothetical protein [Parvimonas sp. G1967]|uniref:hypothetical protein n=1 Tax=Parvimonas sp. G1967 TaxID=3387695 RepID=UPI0039E6F0B6
MNTQKKAFCYNDVANSFRVGIDYNKTQNSTVLAFSNLKEKSTSECRTKESKEDIENNIFFKGCIAGMLTAFAIILFIMNFIKELMY